MFREISPREIEGNPFQMIADEWMLISAGSASAFNMMTASWGYLGEMWGKDTAVAVVRPQRYTRGFMEKSDLFTLSFYGDKGKPIHSVCGSKSGRDIDKAAATGLTPVFSDGTVYFEQARLVLICKKLYTGDIEPSRFLSDGIDGQWYPEKDYHRAYVGEIVKVLVQE